MQLTPADESLPQPEQQSQVPAPPWGRTGRPSAPFPQNLPSADGREGIAPLCLPRGRVEGKPSQTAADESDLHDLECFYTKSEAAGPSWNQYGPIPGPYWFHQGGAGSPSRLLGCRPGLSACF